MYRTQDWRTKGSRSKVRVQGQQLGFNTSGRTAAAAAAAAMVVQLSRGHLAGARAGAQRARARRRHCCLCRPTSLSPPPPPPAPPPPGALPPGTLRRLRVAAGANAEDRDAGVEQARESRVWNTGFRV